MNLRIYCINLKSRPDRWDRFRQQPGLLRLAKQYPFERFEGVNGKEIDIQKDNRISVRTRRNILYHKRRDHEDLDTAGGVGCYLSHYGVWNSFAQSGEEAALIFEDDAIIPEDYLEQLQTHWNELQELGSLQPDVWVLSRPFDKHLSFVLGEEAFHREGNWSFNVHAPNTGYIVFRRGVKKLIENALPVDGHLDHYMYRLAQIGTIVHVQRRGFYLYTIKVTEPGIVDTNIHENTNCDVCDLPYNIRGNGYLVLNGQTKVSLLVLLLGLGGLYLLKPKK